MCGHRAALPSETLRVAVTAHQPSVHAEVLAERAVRRDGREPLGLAAAISLMMTERGMVAPAAGGNVLALLCTKSALRLPDRLPLDAAADGEGRQAE
ncbi:hypothetical protein SBI_01233 [Streptomyces bingchenggensis BCW-1]|uniref:Uncharacterized protein n=1 Tax=Streptomyces bingchenggensis (strain BCW-1) TaxID=749414 RepID=D7CA26_STRBB|nr:hypothetical protein SBI_01233 [Streptomyces bingchenggensis BCW-1]